MGNRGLKIALICTEKLPVPPIRGGAIQILIDGVLPFLGRKHRVTVYCPDDPELPPRETKLGIDYVRLPRDNYVQHVGKALQEARKAGKRYDVVHVFNRPKDLLVYEAAMPESRFVVSLHNEMYREHKISEEDGLRSIRKAKRIMCISDYIGKTIVSRFPSAKGKLRTVYSGIDLNQYKPIWSKRAQAARAELRKTYNVEGKKVVLFVGRLSAVKGPDVLVQAMEHVVREIPNAVLVIVGAKSFQEQMSKYMLQLREIAEPMMKHLRFTGFVEPKRLPSIFLMGDVFVCSSQWEEPLARVHYEAMGAGLPIITTDRGGNAEIVNHRRNGLVIEDYSNPKAFADAILYMLRNKKEAERMAKAGRELAERNHGFEHVAKRLERLYEEAMGAERK
ncbi:glycosyltransferase family 4 protein [Paenibacillus antri]|uniref:glycosyltransferase family 4 protein n=1 Tax=Paenibacillus antri TaxID=2582848 RepID=UPI001EE4A3F3|nr:glycosyltransferase family 4 protein [Paenibacillus antri]